MVTEKRTLATTRTGLMIWSVILGLVTAGLIGAVMVRNVALIALFAACFVTDVCIVFTLARARQHPRDRAAAQGTEQRPASKTGSSRGHPRAADAPEEPATLSTAPDRSVTAHCWRYRILSTSLMLLFILVCLGSASEEPGGLWSQGALGGWLVSAPFMLAAFRHARARLHADQTGLRMRGVFRNRTIPREQIARIESVSYSGSLNSHGQSGLYKMPKLLLVSGKVVELPAFVGSASSIDTLVAQVNHVLGLTSSPLPSAPGKHRH